jgi:hypothetical protein
VSGHDTQAVIDMRDVAVRVMTGELASDGLSMLAAEALAEGQDSPALRELAGLSHSEHREAQDLLSQVLDELRLPPAPSEEEAHWEMARRYASLIASNTIPAIDGANAIAWHAGSLMFPESLATFAYLADLWEDMPSKRSELEQEIVREASLILEGP